MRLVFDFIDHMDDEKLHEAMQWSDRCKAFDFMSWKLIFEIGSDNGFGAYFYKCVKIIFKTSYCCIVNNN